MTDPVIRRRNRANKRRGATYEVALVQWFRDRKWDAERISKKGKGDEGDVAVRLGTTFTGVAEYLVIEAKDEARHNFSGYLLEAAAEEQHFLHNRSHTPTSAVGIAVVKRRGKGVGESYVVMSLDTLHRLLT